MEGFASFFVEDIAVGDEAAGILPFIVRRKHVQCEEFDDLYA